MMIWSYAHCVQRVIFFTSTDMGLTLYGLAEMAAGQYQCRSLDTKMHSALAPHLNEQIRRHRFKDLIAWECFLVESLLHFIRRYSR